MKKIFSLLLSAVLLCGLCAAALPAAGVSSSDAVTADERAEGTVPVLITLSSPDLLEQYRTCATIKAQTEQRFSDFLLSAEGQQATAQLHAQQEALRKCLQDRFPTIDFSESRSYTAITNAMTARVTLSDVDTLRQMVGIRRVTALSFTYTEPTVRQNREVSQEEREPEEVPDSAEVSQEESDDGEVSDMPAEDNEDGEDVLPSREESDGGEGAGVSETVREDEPEPEQKKVYDTYGMASKNSINIRAAYEAGYTGQGRLIAVIDNEFNVHHKVFSVPPPSPRYTQEIMQAMLSFGFGFDDRYTAEDIFFNGKIVYAYDYGENDNVCRSDGSQHGTHVAGIAAGNNGGQGTFDFKGTAYDAQLALFKIADKSGQLQDDAIIAALDDAVKLAPDVINCSYGAIEYLTHDYEGKQLYESLMQSGTAIAAAAGNDAYNGYAMGAEDVPTSYVQYSTICSPSSMDGAFSVAASVPEAVYVTHYSLVFNEENRVPTRMIYADLSFEDVYGEMMAKSVPLSQEVLSEEAAEDELDCVDYVYLDDIGQNQAFQRRRVKDKIVIVHESTLPIETLIKRSIQYGCYAVIVITKEKNSRLRQNSDLSDFFVYTVDSTQTEYFRSHPTGRVSIRSDRILHEETEANADTVTAYSSFGAKADLTLKPDITAPGDNIFSSVDKQGFGVMSGTSMASPCAAGAYAILQQYVYSEEAMPLLSPSQTQELIYQLLMSTAKILTYPDTDKQLAYSPRQQGAGCIDLEKALRTRAYLSVDDARPSVSMGESAEGKYRFSFEVTNLSEEPLVYTPDCLLQTDGYRLSEENEQQPSRYVHRFEPDDIRSHAEVTFAAEGKTVNMVTVPPHETTTVTVTIALSEVYRTAHSRVFPNGFYVEGFVCLRDQSEEGVDLHLPFMGFCGDWSKGPIFPANLYTGQAFFPMGQSNLAIVSAFETDDSAFAEIADKNVFDYNDLPSILSFGRNSLQSYLHIPEEVYSYSCVLLPNIDVLRDVMDYTISIYDQRGILLFCQNFGDVSSYFSPYSAPYTCFTGADKQAVFRQYADFTSTLAEGVYTYILSASTVGTDGNPQRREHLGFRVKVDNTRPVIRDYYLQKTAEGRLYLNVTAEDNTCLQGLRLSAMQYDTHHEIAARFDLWEDMLSYWGSQEALVSYHYDTATRQYVFRYDLTHYKQFLRAKINEQSEIYQDEDVTIIFEKETDYSSVERSLLLLEAVDSAYNGSEEQVVHIDHYGEAVLHLVDEEGQPLNGVTLTHRGHIYESDANGCVMLKNLPLGGNECYLPMDYVRRENGRPYLPFTLTKENYRYEGTFVLKERVVPSTPSEPEVSRPQEKTVIVNFRTGDTVQRCHLIVMTITAAAALTAVAACSRRRPKRRLAGE